MIYLDNSATTRQYDEVTELIAETSRTSFANASSLHNLGFNAGSVIFDARREIEDRFAPGGAVANTTKGVDKSYAIQAGREIRVAVKPSMVKDDEIPMLARDIAKKIEAELEYPGQIKVNVIRETRATEIAK